MGSQRKRELKNIRNVVNRGAKENTHFLLIGYADYVSFLREIKSAWLKQDSKKYDQLNGIWSAQCSQVVIQLDPLLEKTVGFIDKVGIAPIGN